VIYVIDASAMIAYLRAEPGGQVVRDLLRDPVHQCLALAINFCEVYSPHAPSFSPYLLFLSVSASWR